jgi:hypothetical protein
MSGVSLNAEIQGRAKGSIKMTHPLDTGHLMASAKWVYIMSDDGEASSFCNVLYPKLDNVQCLVCMSLDQQLLTAFYNNHIHLTVHRCVFN